MFLREESNISFMSQIKNVAALLLKAFSCRGGRVGLGCSLMEHLHAVLSHAVDHAAETVMAIWRVPFGKEYFLHHITSNGYLKK